MTNSVEFWESRGGTLYGITSKNVLGETRYKVARYDAGVWKPIPSKFALWRLTEKEARADAWSAARRNGWRHVIK